MIASSCRVVMCCMRLGDCMLARYDNIDLQYFLTKPIFFLQGGYRIVEQASKYQRHLRSVPGEASLIHKYHLTLPNRQ